MEEWRLKTALSSGRKQWTNRLYKQAGAQKKLPCFTSFNLWLRELVMLLGGAGVAISTFLNPGPDHLPQFSTMTFYQRFCSWGWGVGANLVHCHSKAIQVPITLTKLRSIGYRQACMNLRGWGGFSLQKCWSVVISGMRSSRLHVYCTFRWAASAL